MAVIAALAIAMLPAARWLRARAERLAIARAERAATARASLWAVPIAARKYQEQFGRPAPSDRALPAGEVAHTGIRWDRGRRAYVVGFAHQSVVNGARDPRGRPIPYTSGATTTDLFAVKSNGNCEYIGSLHGGPY
jgi:hypothetical protein